MAKWVLLKDAQIIRVPDGVHPNTTHVLEMAPYNDMALAYLKVHQEAQQRRLDEERRAAQELKNKKAGVIFQ